MLSPLKTRAHPIRPYLERFELKFFATLGLIILLEVRIQNVASQQFKIDIL